MYKEAKDKGLNPCEIGPDWNPPFGRRSLLAFGQEYFLAAVETLNRAGNWGWTELEAEIPQPEVLTGSWEQQRYELRGLPSKKGWIFNQSCPYELSYYIFLVTSLGKQTKKTPMS